MYEKATTEFKKALALYKGQNLVAKWYLCSTYALSGRSEKACKILDELIELSRVQYVSPEMI
jgi:hypothetical protein